MYNELHRMSDDKTVNWHREAKQRYEVQCSAIVDPESSFVVQWEKVGIEVEPLSIHVEL